MGQLEGTVQALGRAVWDEDPDWYLAHFGEFYDGGIEAFGSAGPGVEARLDAELWFLLDCPLEGGETPLHRIRQRASGRAFELLARSELRAWRIESVEGAGVLGALCPLGTGWARLETVRRPHGELTRGAILVARSVPIGPGRWGLLGRAPIVDRAAAGDYDSLLASLDSPRGEFWRVHGGVLARAAWGWPEDREHTLDGHIVEGSLAVFALSDPLAALAALGGDPELEDADGAPEDRDVIVRFTWCWDPPRARAFAHARAGARDRAGAGAGAFEHDPGVRAQLCDEDAAARPFLARIGLDLDGAEVCVLAPTPSRLALAERLLVARLGPALGPVTLREVDPPNVVPRWKRAAFEREVMPLTWGARWAGAGRAAWGGAAWGGAA